MTNNEHELSEKCPRCAKMLYSVNYAYSSGIIIDKCSEHGVWLDKGELENIQINAEHWKVKANESKGQIKSLLKDVKDKQVQPNSKEGPSSSAFMNRVIHSILKFIE